MFGLHLVPDAKHWRRLWSVQLMIASAFFGGASSVVPMLWGGSPFAVDHPFYFAGIMGVLNVGAIVGRLVDQPNVPEH